MRSQRYLPVVIIAALAWLEWSFISSRRGAEEKGPAYKRDRRLVSISTRTKQRKNTPGGISDGRHRRGDERRRPLEAYAAQAIVARTFTLELIGRGGTKEFHQTDICTDEKHAQAYNAGAVTPAIRRAVEMTRGEVMTYGGNYTKGWFSASCGGRTAPAQVALGFTGEEPAYITSVNCPEESVIPEEELYWSARFSRAELDAILKTLGKSVGQVRRLEIGEKHEDSHRVTRLDFRARWTGRVAGGGFPESRRSGEGPFHLDHRYPAGRGGNYPRRPGFWPWCRPLPVGGQCLGCARKRPPCHRQALLPGG